MRLFYQKSPAQKQGLRERLKRAKDPDYWKSLCPDLHVGELLEGSGEAMPRLDEELDDAAETMLRTGYFHFPPTVSLELCGRLRAGVDRLREAGWPAGFLWVYDECWQLSRLPSVKGLLQRHLGEGYRSISNLWAYYVRPERGAHGWKPHADGGLHSHHRVNVWIPLAPSTLDNGCMYIVPRDLSPAGFVEQLVSGGPADFDVWYEALATSRALPAEPGEILGWDFDVIHWGAVCQGASEPRVSIAMEFIGAEEAPIEDELPLLPAEGALPDWKTRILCISKAIESYSRFEPDLLPHETLANRLHAWSLKPGRSSAR